VKLFLYYQKCFIDQPQIFLPIVRVSVTSEMLTNFHYFPANQSVTQENFIYPERMFTDYHKENLCHKRALQIRKKCYSSAILIIGSTGKANA